MGALPWRCSSVSAAVVNRSLPRTLLLALAVLMAARPARAERVIRVATLLPAGTSWMKELTRFARRVQAASDGTLRIRLYPGAVMGDERDVVDKIAAGRLEGGVLTAAGLGRIVPAVRALELPFLFRSPDEMRRVRAQLRAEYDRLFVAKGFKLIGWGDQGWLRLFSKQPITTLAQLRRAKAWAWADDPLALAIMRRMGLPHVPLAVQAVLPSLQTGIIDTTYGSAYTTLALQWHTQLSWYSDYRVNYVIGGVVLSHKAFAALSARQRQTLMRNVRWFEQQHQRRTEADNRAALRLLRSMGFRRSVADPQLRAHFDRVAQALRRELVGKMYSAELLQRILTLRDALRAEQPRVR